MPEPQATTAALVAGGVVTITGSILGVQYDALIAGFVGGLVALLHLPPMPKLRTFGSVFSASFLAGVFAPVAVAATVQQAEWIARVGEVPLRMAAAAGIGLFAQLAIPLVFTAIRRRGEQV